MQEKGTMQLPFVFSLLLAHLLEDRCVEVRHPHEAVTPPVAINIQDDGGLCVCGSTQ
jgi:hypothetical protein